MKKIAIFLLVASAWAADVKPRVYITNHESWLQSSSFVATASTAAGRTEQIKSLSKSCPAITITEDQSRADFIVAWDSKTWQQTSWGGHENEFTVYNSGKDLVGSGATHHMKNTAKDICKVLTRSPQ